MTAVMKYAGALGLDELEAEVRRGFRKAARRSSLTPGTVGVQENTVPALRRDTVSHSALLRFGAINLAGFALLGAAWARGWIDVVVAADQTGMTFAIFGVFIAGLVICGAKLWRTGREMIAAQSALPGGGTWTSDYLTDIGGRDSGARAIMASTLRLRLSDWIAVIRHFANSLGDRVYHRPVRSRPVGRERRQGDLSDGVAIARGHGGRALHYARRRRSQSLADGEFSSDLRRHGASDHLRCRAGRRR